MKGCNRLGACSAALRSFSATSPESWLTSSSERDPLLGVPSVEYSEGDATDMWDPDGEDGGV